MGAKNSESCLIEMQCFGEVSVVKVRASAFVSHVETQCKFN